MAEPWDTVKTIYDAQLLRTLTNSNNPGASSINDTIGNLAGSYATEEFAVTVGVSYDNTITSHKWAICELVIFILQTWANKLGDSAAKREKIVYDRLKRLSETVGGRPRVTATTSSPDVPTDDTRGGTISNPKPWSDVSHFDQITPSGPASGGDSTFPNSFPV